jgi:hypothetical protein
MIFSCAFIDGCCSTLGMNCPALGIDDVNNKALEGPMLPILRTAATSSDIWIRMCHRELGSRTHAISAYDRHGLCQVHIDVSPAQIFIQLQL